MSKIKQIAFERQTINQAIRLFFNDRGFIEVETPVVVKSPGMESNLSPFNTLVIEPNGKEYPAALITSPEYSMKKLLGNGMKKIFTITKVFRNHEEFGGNHNPEFSMLEWYMQGGNYIDCMNETEELINFIDQKLQSNSRFKDVLFQKTRVKDLFKKYTALNLDSAKINNLKEVCDKNGIHFADNDTESDLFYRIFLDKIEPNISGTQFVYDYPKHQASLSKLTDDGLYGQRFELYVDGLELCNGFTELTDTQEQKERFIEESNERKKLNKKVYPIDEALLELLPSINQHTYGNALGIDRLHMILTKRNKIEDVMLFNANKIFK